MLLTTKPVMNPALAPSHHPSQPKAVVQTRMQSLFIVATYLILATAEPALEMLFCAVSD